MRLGVLGLPYHNLIEQVVSPIFKFRIRKQENVHAFLVVQIDCVVKIDRSKSTIIRYHLGIQGIYIWSVKEPDITFLKELAMYQQTNHYYTY